MGDKYEKSRFCVLYFGKQKLYLCVKKGILSTWTAQQHPEFFFYFSIHPTMNRSSTLFLLLFAWTLSASAQNLSIFNQVIGSTGHFSVEDNQQWTYTVGEVVIETIGANNRTLTQGVHQPEFARPVFTIDPELLAWNIEVFPNPTADMLNVRFDSNQSGLLEAMMFDLYGRMLMQPQTLDLATFCRR